MLTDRRNAYLNANYDYYVITAEDMQNLKEVCASMFASANSAAHKEAQKLESIIENSVGKLYGETIEWQPKRKPIHIKLEDNNDYNLCHRSGAYILKDGEFWNIVDLSLTCEDCLDEVYEIERDQ